MMILAKRARTAETPIQTSCYLRLRALPFYPHRGEERASTGEAGDASRRKVIHGRPLFAKRLRLMTRR